MNQFKGLYVPADYRKNHLWSSTYCHIASGANMNGSCKNLRCSDCLFYGMEPHNQKIFQEWLDLNILIENRSKKLERILNEQV